MKIGTVISSKDGLFVVTELENGYVSETQKIQDFIAENVVVQYEGQQRTLKDIIEIQCDLFLSTHEIIEEKK